MNLQKIRGQCYDSAANMKGHKTGVQTRIRELEPRALFVHCFGHSLNLVAQDGMQNINVVKNFLGTVREFVRFVRNSPMRLDFFKDIQSESDTPLPQLSPFCPTR